MIMVVEAGPDRVVPWTKPQDLYFDSDNPTAALGNVPEVAFARVVFRRVSSRPCVRWNHASCDLSDAMKRLRNVFGCTDDERFSGVQMPLEIPSAAEVCRLLIRHGGRRASAPT
jgi:hypothetical protein